MDADAMSPRARARARKRTIRRAARRTRSAARSRAARRLRGAILGVSDLEFVLLHADIQLRRYGEEMRKVIDEMAQKLAPRFVPDGTRCSP